MWGYTALLPLFSALMWLGMLLGMLLTWVCTGKPHYPSFSSDQHIAYISDVGAFRLKPLFITGSTITVVFLDLGFISERWLRHNGRLAANSAAQKWLSITSILFAIVGACGLILLSIFDTYRHHRAHEGLLLLFIAGYIISAILICAEYQRLGIHYRNLRILRISFWIKLVFIIVEVCLAIAFASTLFTHANPAAVIEWAIAFIFTLYTLSFVLDLLPSVQNARHVPQGAREAEKRLEEGGAIPGQDGYQNGGTAQYPSTGRTETPQRTKRGFGRLHF